MKLINDIKNMNQRQKDRLVMNLRWLVNQIWFQMFVATSFIYIILMLWGD